MHKRQDKKTTTAPFVLVLLSSRATRNMITNESTERLRCHGSLDSSLNIISKDNKRKYDLFCWHCYDHLNHNDKFVHRITKRYNYDEANWLSLYNVARCWKFNKILLTGDNSGRSQKYLKLFETTELNFKFDEVSFNKTSIKLIEIFPSICCMCY